jgi:hypothetical protein
MRNTVDVTGGKPSLIAVYHRCSLFYIKIKIYGYDFLALFAIY